MLEIIDDINKSVSSENCVLVSFDVVNMFPNIDNKSGLLSVKEALTNSNFDVHSTQFIVDALEICLTCNNSKFNHQHFLQSDDTAHGPHMSCSCADIAMAKYESLANKFHLKPSVWKRFRDDVFVLWEHGTASFSSFLDYLNTMDKTGKIKFTMEIAGDKGLEFLHLKLRINEGNIRVDVFAKSTNSFSYTTPNTCYPESNICNILRGIALRLRRICDDDETFKKRSSEYQNYLIARDHKPSIVKKQFSEIKNKRRFEARKKQTKEDKVSDLKLITTYNPALLNIHNIIQKNLSILHTDENMKKVCPSTSIKTLHRREKNLKEILSLSLFPAKLKNSESCITSCKKCDIFKNYLLTDNKFKCKVTGRFYIVRANLSCNSINVIYLISCKNCDKQYIGSAIDFKARFRIHKSNIKTKKGRCGTTKQFNTKCSDVQNPHRFLQVQLIESVVSDLDLENKLWEREKYWQCQLFTKTHGMNNVFDLHASKRMLHCSLCYI